MTAKAPSSRDEGLAEQPLWLRLRLRTARAHVRAELSRAQTALFAPEGGGWLTGCERRGSSTGIRQTVLFGQDSPSDRDWPGLTIDSIFLTARGSGYVMEQLWEGAWLRE